jgi:WD40 repeat protein
MRTRVTASVILVLVAAGTAVAQNDRRDRQSPELILETGGRLGSLDVLKFTSIKDEKGELLRDQFVLAVGDDKVIRMWPYRDGKLHEEGMKVLRWSIWREQRGAIFALALKPDRENSEIAVAGFGFPTLSSVAVIDRVSGKILHHAIAKPPEGKQSNSIWSLDYAPDGNSVAFGDSFGGVWTWDFKSAPVRLGDHGSGNKQNIVRFVHYFTKDVLASAAQDGSIWRWDLSEKEVRSKKLDSFATGNLPVYRVAVSQDEKWLAAGCEGPLVILRSSSDGKESFAINLEEFEQVRAVAFDSANRGLAVSISAHIKPTEKDKAPFYMEAKERIVFYDLDDIRKKNPVASPGPDDLFRAWFVAFHPRPDVHDMAYAAGPNHEVNLWDLENKRTVSVLAGKGRSIWGVALSTDGQQIGFRDQRDEKSRHPNERADTKQPWRVFNVRSREWGKDEFKPIKQIPDSADWKVVPDSPKPGERRNPFRWYVVTPKGPYPLPWNDGINQQPYCYTFIPQGGNKPPRLAVGHLWGFSIFEFDRDREYKPKLLRLCVGHQGYVTSLSVSADGSILIAGSMDQTISGWSLKDWPSHPTFGARFEIEKNKLIVKKVDVGGPAWEAGLVEGDEVYEYHFAGAKDELPGGPKTWLDSVRRAEPGLEHRFDVLRDGKQVRLLATTLRQRPLWKFFPTADGEWVMWMWQGSYYDTSTNGDSYLRWHVNAADVGEMPTIYRAEQFRKLYNRKAILNRLLQTWDMTEALKLALGENPQPPRFNELEPPTVKVVLGDATEKGDRTASLTVRPQPTNNPDFNPARAELWINDHRVLVADAKDLAAWRKGDLFEKDVPIPDSLLRAGDNVLTFQVYNKLGGRAEAVQPVSSKRKAAPRRLFILAVGVDDYSGSKVTGDNGREPLPSLTSARRDAETIVKEWQGQTRLFPRTDQKNDLILRLDAKAKRDDILKALKDLADRVGPEDSCILFFSGHGTFDDLAPGKDDATWRFCCPDFDETRKNATSITNQELYDKLAEIAGRKIVLLDACHSGFAATAADNPVRALAPTGQGPIIIAACDRNQLSLESKERKHGLFTAALLEALGEKFGDAAADKKTLDAGEMFRYTRRRMPSLLKELKPPAPEFAQRPIMFAPEDMDFKTIPVAKSKE